MPLTARSICVQQQSPSRRRGLTPAQLPPVHPHRYSTRERFVQRIPPSSTHTHITLPSLIRHTPLSFVSDASSVTHTAAFSAANAPAHAQCAGHCQHRRVPAPQHRHPALTVCAHLAARASEQLFIALAAPRLEWQTRSLCRCPDAFLCRLTTVCTPRLPNLVVQSRTRRIQYTVSPPRSSSSK